MNLFHIFLFIFLCQVVFSLYKAKHMGAFRSGYPEEYAKAGSPGWFFGGISTSTFWFYLLKRQYRANINDPAIARFLDRVGIIYLAHIPIVAFYVVAIESGALF